MTWALMLAWAPTLAAEPLPVIEFSIRPHLCVLTAQEEVCRDTVEISWISPQARDLCLHSDRRDAPLRCWQQALSGQFALTINTASNIHFYLKNGRSRNLVAAGNFEVIQDNQTYRRKRRNPWSFF
jgi:hypothetical protein